MLAVEGKGRCHIPDLEICGRVLLGNYKAKNFSFCHAERSEMVREAKQPTESKQPLPAYAERTCKGILTVPGGRGENSLTGPCRG